MKNISRVHFIGIGGSGMYPLAQILHSEGFSLSGSDNNETDTLASVRNLGITVFLGHNASNVEGTQLVVHSAAIMKDNPEIVAAQTLGIPCVDRSEMLGFVTKRFAKSICISGTHGKTTATSMLTQILLESHIDPSAVIGGKLEAIGGSGKVGSSDVLVVEACEFVDTFLKLESYISVILNVDEDHLDYFGSLSGIIKSFNNFAKKAKYAIVVNGDDENSLTSINGICDKKIITFGFGDGNDYCAKDIKINEQNRPTFELFIKGDHCGSIILSVPGKHNVLNALAAIACAHELGVDIESIACGLIKFHGAGRRFEILGERCGVIIADDYAHHPAELKVTLEAAMQMGYKNVWAVFQPFTYSRTSILFDDFVEVLKIPDRVVLSEIMGSREVNTYDIYSKDLAEKINGCVWFDTFEEIVDYTLKHAQSGDLVITLGCGDIYKAAKMMLKK